jgi:hypothetical protein
MSVDTAVIAPRCRAAGSSVSNTVAVASLRSCRNPSPRRAPHRRAPSKIAALSALDFVEPDVTGLPFDACAIPVREERLLGTAGFAPDHAVAHGRVTGRHRLTVHSDLLPRAASDGAFTSANSMRSVRIAFRRPGRRAAPPTQQRSAQAAGYCLGSLYSNR